MSASLRRLVKDHASLRKSLPPNYFFEDSNDGSSLPDDLTQLVIFLAGADGTPYAHGLWRLHLNIPLDYPKSPPKATFKTRIFHPNVEEQTGAVCLETLKRDWDPKLTLKDILITISCLLIHPNPDSALNATAGSLIQEDYDGFARKAKLMTNIHAPIPKQWTRLVDEAKRRGEDTSTPKSEPSKDEQCSTVISESTNKDNTKENTNCRSQQVKPQTPSSPKQLYIAKRPLLDIAESNESEDDLPHGQPPLDRSQSIEATTEPKRKSPKYKHDGQVDKSNEPILVSGNNENCTQNTKPLMKDRSVSCPSIGRMTNRSALRKVSNVGNGPSRSQARTGIRRL